jgi:hypothetical protein
MHELFHVSGDSVAIPFTAADADGEQLATTLTGSMR